MQGFGNVAQYAIRLYRQIGGTVICVSSWDQNDQTSYSFRKAHGRRPRRAASAVTDRFGGIDKDKARKALGYEVLPGDAWLEEQVEILMPSAIENQIRGDNVGKIAATVKLIAEGANGPTTPEADAIIADTGITLIPDFLANAGGVTCSYFEQVQSNHEHVLGEGRGARPARRHHDRGVPRRRRDGAKRKLADARCRLRDLDQPGRRGVPRPRLGVTSETCRRSRPMPGSSSTPPSACRAWAGVRWVARPRG